VSQHEDDPSLKVEGLEDEHLMTMGEEEEVAASEYFLVRQASWKEGHLHLSFQLLAEAALTQQTLDDDLLEGT